MAPRMSALMVLLLAGLALAQAPEPIEVLPRIIPTDAAGDPLPAGARARMGTLRWRHGGPVHFVGFLADGNEIVSASLDGFIRVWDVATGRELRRWKWHAGGVPDDEEDAGLGTATIRSITRSPDRRLIAATLPGGKVQIWTSKGVPEQTVASGHDSQNGDNGLAFSPDSRLLAVRGGDHFIHLWEVRTGKLVGRLAPDENAVPRVGNVMFYGRMGNTLAFSPDGKMLAAMNTWNTENARGLVILYDLESGKPLRRIEGGERSLSGRVAFGPDLLAVAWGNRETQLYDPATGKELRQLGEPKEENIIHAVVFSPDGQVVATRSASATPTLTLYEAATGKKLRQLGEQPVGEQDNIFTRLTGPGCSSLTLDFSPDGQRIAEAAGGRVVRVWEAK